jgi:hypothetical protein
MHLRDTIFEEYQIKCNASLQKVLKTTEKATEAERQNVLQSFISECDKWIKHIDRLKVDFNQQKAKAMIYWNKVFIYYSFSSYISRSLNYN